MQYQIKTARGPLEWVMRRCGLRGWVSLWRTIYVLPGHEHDEGLIRHERRHLAQIEEDGRVMFTLVYLYWLVLHGYWNNPYEIEARAAENPSRDPA